MSLFSGLDGEVESLPTLIDEEDLLFGGGEDLFEFLDEASAGDRALAAPVVPAAVPVAAAPAIPVAIPTTLESREPPNYRAPCFFPFGKPEATAPQLKVSGVSSFKKINSRLMQGGVLNEREEADAIRELERALGVLGHQKRFLQDHKASLEKWALDVYGFSFSTEDTSSHRVDDSAAGEDPPAAGSATTENNQGPSAVCTLLSRDLRVTIKCKGGDKRRTDKVLVAQVHEKWLRRRQRLIDGRKRSLCETEGDKPAKRSKLPVRKAEQICTVEANGDVEENAEEAVKEERTEVEAHGLDPPGELWNWLEESSFFSPISRRQPFPEDLTLEAEDRLGRTTLLPLRSSAPTPKAIPESGVRRGAADHADILRYRLASALVPPGSVDNVSRSHVGHKGIEGMQKKLCGQGTLHVLDVTELSLEQRILVQLNGLGLVGSSRFDHIQHQGLADRIKILNRVKLGLRQGIKATT